MSDDNNNQLQPLEQLQSLNSALVCDAATGVCAPAGQAGQAPAAGRFSLPRKSAEQSGEDAG